MREHFDTDDCCKPLYKEKKIYLSLSLSAERLYNSNGRDLRRALFSLKQIFQVTCKHTHISLAITVSLLLQNAVSYCGHCALP